MKYSIIYSCGHEGSVELFGKTSERDNKIEWYKNQAKCPECYKMEIREQNKKMGLIITINIDVYSQDENCIILTASGDSFSKKDDLKSIGYYFGDIPSTGFFGLLSTSAPAKNWFKCVKVDNLNSEIKKAQSIDAKIENKISDVDIAARSQTIQISKDEADKKEKDETEIKIKREAELKEIENLKPYRPSCIPSGSKFNWKVYGTKGKFNIYIDGIKKNISNTEASEIEKFNVDYEIYKTAKDKIK